MLRRHLGAGALSTLEILVLGLLAAYIVLLAIPEAFRIESECVGLYGHERVGGDSYFAAAAVLGTFGWLGVATGAIFAQIAESARAALLLPLVWFVVFVGGFLVAAMAMGPQLCPS
jgi:hypothetical protein